MTDDRALLVLADGTTFFGTAFGARVESWGEVVFNTSMTGYPELLTDPSYRRQIITLTVPEVGNYGVTRRDAESDRIQAAGLVVRALSPVVSNWRSELDLSSWLAEAGVPGIAGVDTRALVRRIRDHGAQMSILSTLPGADVDDLRARAKALPSMAGMDLLPEVTCIDERGFTGGLVDDAGAPVAGKPARFHVVAVDLGMKANMARLLVHHGCRVTIVPSTTTASRILALKPDGVLFSNGPGDPSTAVGVVEAMKGVLGKVPVFGICMGHQILGQALGASTYKTRFGHRGGNQPVLAKDGRVRITSQNHGFAVQRGQLTSSGGAESEHNLSDETNEGIDALDRWAFSVQYHPEAAPGPHDADVHFGKFVELMEKFRSAARSGRASS